MRATIYIYAECSTFVLTYSVYICVCQHMQLQITTRTKINSVLLSSTLHCSSNLLLIINQCYKGFYIFVFCIAWFHSSPIECYNEKLNIASYVILLCSPVCSGFPTKQESRKLLSLNALFKVLHVTLMLSIYAIFNCH